VSAVKFQLIYLRKSHILLEEDGKIRYLRDAVRIIARRDSPTERELLLKELAQEFGVSLDTLKQESIEVRQQEKLGNIGDIPAGSWNNVWNEKRSSSSKNPPLGSANVNAERQLLSWMLQDKETALLVQQRLGDRFHVEDHAAIAAYLYAYYAEGNEPDVGRFVTVLQDDRLERAASAIALIEVPYGERELEDFLRTIERASESKDILERKNEEMHRADRAGDKLLAAQILIEIIALNKQRKSL
jgi:DNA primase